jgi:hypothetical protein
MTSNVASGFSRVVTTSEMTPPAVAGGRGEQMPTIFSTIGLALLSTWAKRAFIYCDCKELNDVGLHGRCAVEPYGFGQVTSRSVVRDNGKRAATW